MSFDPDRVSTVTVDSYSTLVDVETAEQALADAVDESEPVSNRWRQRSLAYTFVSNGDPEMLASMVEHADIGDLIVDTISADEIRTFKPAAELYRHAAARTGTPIDEVVHVTAGWFDVMGARHAGMQGVRVDRKGLPWEPFDGEPDYTVESFHELAEALGA
jgi:2-haloacid dehalogenase